MFDIDADYLQELWENQDGKCYYFGIPMEFGTKSLESASLDRVVPTGGYVKGNVAWCSKFANYAKNDEEVSSFKRSISKIVSQLVYGVPRAEVVIRHPNAKMPHRGRDTDAGYDVYAVSDVTVGARSLSHIDTGLAVVAPAGYYLTVEGRSSMYRSGIVPFRGIVDGGYTGNMIVTLQNTTDIDYHIKCGDRIAQIVVERIIHMDFQEVQSVSPEYDIRGDKGFGSSGR